ncbi:hypothetical protein KFK09_023871 [Dendrobium nobile]|uniref:Transcription factor CBF/NF-Y/archaeal histone domain-containing protein n=1 Tax=Dendrobium nobile TaxID=94219 RepID=A0A8T3AB09_DENNO|nr:hypothetical protein KFK09_023871 [Dendrobium nobile]
MRQAGIYSGMMWGKKPCPNSLPLSRIKKIMKQSGEDVKMISCEAPLVFAKACELFIQQLTVRSYKISVQAKKRTLQKDDVVTAVKATEVFDFLMEMVTASDADDCMKTTRERT